MVPLLTEEEAASFLNVHPQTLRKVRARGQIAFVRIGRSIRYSKEEVVSFVERATVANDPLPARAMRGRSGGRKSKIIPFTQMVKR